MQLRAITRDDYDAVARLICESTNRWYAQRNMGPIFTAGPAACRVFTDVYEALDPGCCVVAADEASGRLMGSCFYHPRETHISLGIMNVHPDFFSRGVARELLRFVCEVADREGKPLRLVSSAMNLDSFSLYTRAGFVPRAAFQDMFIDVPAGGLSVATPGLDRVRPATLDDVEAMVSLEMEIAHISRAKDFRHFIENPDGIWHVSVLERADGAGAARLHGFLASVNHPGSNMLGPGVARTPADAATLILSELDYHRGRRPVFLVPVECDQLVRTLYGFGARNCEIHFAQVRGRFDGFHGVVMPTFMPETG
jgi:GNAT superfamily N-acetyltransferase